MKKAPISSNEAARLATLKSYKILDTAAEKQLDYLTQVAATVCNAQIALISLVDSDRQWFKSKIGLDTSETPRDISFCGHAILNEELFVIEDSQLDDRFSDNPLVTGAPFIRFYAGAPLIAPNGHRIGTLCVIDSQPKTLTSEQKQILKVLAKQVISYLELNKKTKELQDSEQSRNIILNNMLEGVVLQEVPGTIIDFNPAALEILGLTEDQLLGRDSMDPRWKSIKEDGSDFPGEEHPAMVTLNTGKKQQNVLMGIEAPEKGRRWLEINSVPITEDDKEVKALTSFRDISKQKELENQLNDTNQYLELALAGAGLGIWDWNLLDNSVKFDKRWAQMIGYELSEISMELSTWQDRVHPDDIDNCFKDIQKYMDGKTDYYENIHRMKHKDGHWVYILDRGRFSKWDENGKPIRFTGTHLDITETKNVQEQKLAELNDILSSTPSGIIILNNKGEILDVNQQGLKLIEAQDLKSVVQSSFYSYVKSTHEKNFKDFNQRICSGSKETLVFEFISLQGKHKWMECYAAPYKLANGDTGNIAIINDISERIATAEEYEKQKALAHHHSKLASLGELAAGVGHEINNPLSIIKGYVTVIDRKALKNNQISHEELSIYVEKIDTAINRISSIVNGLRTFSRSDYADFSNFDPIDAITESYNMVNEIYSKDGIELDYNNQCSQEVFITGNRGKMQQVLMNLLSNARDAIANQVQKKIEITIKQKGEFIEIRLQDNGPGIPVEIQGKIFDPFFTTKEVNKGTGIGLSLVHNFIKEMDGRISIDNSYSNGTAFVIEIPVKVGVVESPTPETTEHIQKQYKACALIVDDEEDIRELLAIILNDLGIEVVEVANGKEALNSYMETPEKFDLIISDIKMPIMDGETLLHELRSLKDMKQPKFIFITGGTHIDFEDQDTEVTQLSDGYIFKPFNEKKISEVIAKTLS